jgi:hypothetical protein
MSSLDVDERDEEIEPLIAREVKPKSTAVDARVDPSSLPALRPRNEIRENRARELNRASGLALRESIMQDEENRGREKLCGLHCAIFCFVIMIYSGLQTLYWLQAHYK